MKELIMRTKNINKDRTISAILRLQNWKTIISLGALIVGNEGCAPQKAQINESKML